ncbi:MAG: TonB family protein [Fibromonadaceae bacterium]|jgi:TonB family protein|nr:TonB family protein [Fibromonadaceae bacterium]
MKNNLMLFFAVLLLLAGTSKADVFEEMFEELTKEKGAKRAKQDTTDTGSRSREEIMQVVNENMPTLNKLYIEYLKQKPGFSGKVVLKFTVAANGKIININIVSSTTGYDKFDKAIKDAVATWKWEAIKSGNTTPTIPFNFTDDSWAI